MRIPKPLLAAALALPLFLAGPPAASAETVTYTDRLGSPVEIEVPRRRVVLLETFEILPVTGAWDRVVGLSRNAYQNDLILAVKPDVAKAIKSPGSIFDSSAESLIELNPDLVITFNYGGRARDIEFWRAKGLTVLSVYPSTIGELYELMRLHGRIFEAEASIERAISAMERIFGLIEERLASLPESGRKKAYWLFLKPNHVGGRKGLSQTLLDIARLQNLAPEGSGDSAEIPLETIYRENPEIIFIWGNAPFGPADLEASPQWRHIEAVKSRQIFKMPHWSTISPRLAPQALMMAAAAYPESFAGVDIPAELDKFFLEAYGLKNSRSALHYD